MIFVTGTVGFIGSNFVLDWLEQGNEPVVNLDLLTYAGNLNWKVICVISSFVAISARNLVANLLTANRVP
jgi:dTDP-D-glucose 4,6-dehydratase